MIIRNNIVLLIILFIAIKSHSQNVNAIKITDLENRIKNSSDTTYVVNFWATWCVPCVKELPSFDSINATFYKSKVKVILVSLDFKEDLKTKLLPFLNSKKIRSEVMLLDETDANYFIPIISETWSGAIPATLIINNEKGINRFFEKKVTYKFLKSEIESCISK